VPERCIEVVVQDQGPRTAMRAVLPSPVPLNTPE
jgi:hypothetical protein